MFCLKTLIIIIDSILNTRQNYNKIQNKIKPFYFSYKTTVTLVALLLVQVNRKSKCFCM